MRAARHVEPLGACRAGSSLQRFILTVEGRGFQDVDEIELPRAPVDGDPIETKLGTCLVIRTDELDEASQFSGRIICRLP